MPEEINIQKLVVKKGLEPISSWESLFKDPESFFEEVARRLALSYEIDFKGIVISDKPPASIDRSKLWVKTSWPYGVGKIIGGSYQMDYGMSGFNPNIPFQALEDPLKEKVRKLSDAEIKEYGLYRADETKAISRLDWYIFEPDEINS